MLKSYILNFHHFQLFLNYSIDNITFIHLNRLLESQTQTPPWLNLIGILTSVISTD